MSERPIRIALNGFGRIGRSVLRILRQQAQGIELVLINEIEPLETCAYLFQYDSVFGPYPGQVHAEAGALIVDGDRIPFTAEADLSALDLRGVDVVLDCTGLAGQRSIAERALEAGAARVLVSGPSDEADITIVLGANEAELSGQRIVSNASCTTNALAPLARVLDASFGIVAGQMTTVHCYTGSQPTVDKPRGRPERSRAAALSMVPTTTSAQKLTERVLPQLAGKIEARAVRVPTACVSAVDLTVHLRDAVDVATINDVLRAHVGPVIGWTNDPVVSSDLSMRPESIVIVGPETSVTGGHLARVFGWYDNEWGFSCRMLDMARLMAQSR